MLPDRVSNPGPLTYESGALPIAPRGPAETIRARAMKHGSCIHIEELRSTLCSILRFDLLFTVH